MVIKRCQIEESMHFSRSFLTTDFKTVIFKYFQANDIFKGFFRVTLPKSRQPRSITVLLLRTEDFVSFFLHGGLIRVYKTGCSYKRVLSTAET
jgi:hypothetical protein